MATSSMIMLSNVSMERLYLSQPPAWNDLQRLPFSSTQQQDGRSSQQIIRTCYDKLLHHMYDINSSSSSSPATTINQINEQLELAAEYCQLKTLRDGNTVYLHSDQFYLEINFDSSTHLPLNISICFTNEQQTNEERFTCSRMFKALNEKQYRLFRAHLNGYASLFTLTAPSMNNDKRIGYTAYKILQQDLERLAKTDMYSKLLEGFQPICEGLPMRMKFDDQHDNNPSLLHNVRIILVPSTNQHYLPCKSTIHIDEKSNKIQLDSSIKSNLLATGHFALEFDENHSPFIFLLTYAQEINRLTNLNNFYSNSKTFNYLSTILPKTKLLNQYHWYISHDQLAISIRQIPFTNLKQLIFILNLIRQQIYLTKNLIYYFNNDYDQDHMDDDDDDDDNTNEISLELSFLSSTILSITCAQSYHLTTFILQMTNINTFPYVINRRHEKEIYLTNEKHSLFKLIEKLLKEHHSNQDLLISNIDLKPVNQQKGEEQQQKLNKSVNIPKLNRCLSTVPPAKLAWRTATTLRRTQSACLTLISKDNNQDKIDDEQFIDEDINQNITNEDFNDDDETFMSSPQQQQQQQQPNQQHHYQQLLPKPSLSFHPSTLSRCTSVSSTQSVSTPPIFGLSPSTPYPSGINNPSGNIFFPLGKQVSVPDYSPVSSPITMGSFDQSFFLSASIPTSSNPMSSGDVNNKTQQKKKRRRSEHSADDFIQTLNNNANDNRSPMHATKLPSSGGGDPSNIKRNKKPNDKNSQQQQQQQQQLVRQKSAFKVTDSPTASLLPQQQVTSPDDIPTDFKPLKVVIKRVGDGGNSSNDESQLQQTIKQRKKQQQQMANNSGLLPTAIRKLPNNNSSGGSSPSVLIKSESLDMSQFSSDSMMTINDGTQQASRERPRPSSSLSNPSTALSSSALSSSALSSSAPSQPRSAPPQPPIVLKIQRSKVYPGQDQSSSSSSLAIASATVVATTSNSIPSSLKEALKHRTRSMPTGANSNKQHVASPPLLAAKLTSPSTGTTNNSLAPPSNTLASLFRIPRKSSSQEVTTKPKTEPGTINNNSSPILSKAAVLPTPGTNNNELSKSITKSTATLAVRPPAPLPPPPQIGSWQSPPTQQPSRLYQNRPRSSWSQQQPPRGRTPVTPPNVSALNSGHTSMPNFSQQPRSILKKPPSNENSTTDLLYMSSSDLPGLNEQRPGINFALPPPPPPRAITPPGMYDDNDDDSSPQAQLVIDTSSNTANNVLLPYTIVPGSSSSSSMIDNFDQTHENNSMINLSQQHQIGDESSPILD